MVVAMMDTSKLVVVEKTPVCRVLAIFGIGPPDKAGNRRRQAARGPLPDKKDPRVRLFRTQWGP